jgi:cytochrome c
MRPLLSLALLLPFAADASDATALLERAAAHYDAKGREAALVDFSKDAGFRQGALYVFCVDRDGKLSANGGFPGLVGMRIDRFEVGTERDLATRMRAQVEQAGSGSIDYVWLNPATGAAERKHSLLQRMGEDICGVGTYTPLPPSGPPRRR